MRHIAAARGREGVVIAFRRISSVAAALFLLTGLSACASTNIYSTANGFSVGSPPPGTTYLLRSDSEKVSEEGLEFREYASFVERALAVKGWSRVSEFSAADQIVFVGFGIGSPQKEQISYSLPVWGKTGISSAYTTGTISTYGNTGTVTATTTYMPTYGITGYNRIVGTVTTYDRWLRLSSIDRKTYDQTGKVSELWKLIVFSNGRTGDLRTVFPYLAMVASRYAGENTGKALKVTYKMEGDEYKAFVSR